MDNPKKRLLSQATAESVNGDESAATTAVTTTTTTTATISNDTDAPVTTAESGAMHDDENNSTTTTLPVAKRPHVDLNARSAAKAEAAGVSLEVASF